MTSPEFREEEPFTRAASNPFHALRRHWVSGTLITLLFAAIGVACAFVVPVTYTAEARVAVGSGDLTSGAIAGFPLAASQLASNYARYVNNAGVAGTDVPEGVELSASQIPDSNVIRIEATSTDPAAAAAAANTAATSLIDAVNADGDPRAAAVFDEFAKASEADAKAQTELAAAQQVLDRLLAKDQSTNAAIKSARAAVTDAAAKADQTSLTAGALRQKYTNLVANTSTAAKLQLVRTAEATSSNRTSWIERLGLLGLVVGLAVSLVVAVRRERGAVTPGRVAAAGEQPAPARMAAETDAARAPDNPDA